MKLTPRMMAMRAKAFAADRKSAEPIIYRMLLRPVSRCTLPDDIEWEFVLAPPDIAHRRPDLPCAPPQWLYGTFRTTNRQLTADELKHFSIVEV